MGLKIEKLIQGNVIGKIYDIDATMEALSNPEALKTKYLNDLLNFDQENQEEEEEQEEDKVSGNYFARFKEL